jgi:hypothetical protein
MNFYASPPYLDNALERAQLLAGGASASSAALTPSAYVALGSVAPKSFAATAKQIENAVRFV